MEPKVIVILGIAGLMFFLSIIMGIIAWVNNSDDESTDDSTTGGEDNSSSGNSGGDNGGDNTGDDNTGDDNTGDDNTGGDNTGGDNTGADAGGTTGGVETCEGAEIHCSGPIYWPDPDGDGEEVASYYHGLDCSAVHPGNLLGQTAANGPLAWIALAYKQGSNHKLIVKDRYGEICRDKEIICEGDEVSWGGSDFDGENCSAQAIAHNSGDNNKSLESWGALEWCRMNEEKGYGCKIGVVDKN